MNFILPFVFVLFLTFPAAADLGYDPRTERFFSTEISSELDADEYHGLSLELFDMLYRSLEAHENLALYVMKIMTFLRKEGTFTALQLAKDMCVLWGYHGK